MPSDQSSYQTYWYQTLVTATEKSVKNDLQITLLLLQECKGTLGNNLMLCMVKSVKSDQSSEPVGIESLSDLYLYFIMNYKKSCNKKPFF